MTIRERLMSALNGEMPDITPLSIYAGWIDFGSEIGRRLRDEGLGLGLHCRVVQAIEHGVERTEETWVENGTSYIRCSIKTPVGTMYELSADGWQREWFIKTPADYKTMQWVVEHTELMPAYEKYDQADATVGDYGVPLLHPQRSPAMLINLDWAGMERFCEDVALEAPELFALYEATKQLFYERIRLVAAGPGRFVTLFENLTISMLGRERYRQLLMPVYEQIAPLLEAGGKRVFAHYDGELRIIADLIAQTPLHGIESLTEPPEGNMRYDECRAAWPEKVLWGNINLGCYRLPPEELKQAVIGKCQRAGKRGVLFEISEDLPPNWETTLPVVLEALREAG